jgi:hypothetical protein
MKTMLVLAKYLEAKFIIESVKIYMVSEDYEIKINTLKFIQKIFDLDLKDKKFESHIAEMEN